MTVPKMSEEKTETGILFYINGWLARNIFIKSKKCFEMKFENTL